MELVTLGNNLDQAAETARDCGVSREEFLTYAAEAWDFAPGPSCEIRESETLTTI